jgi:hypothetical protein
MVWSTRLNHRSVALHCLGMAPAVSAAMPPLCHDVASSPSHEHNAHTRGSDITSPAHTHTPATHMCSHHVCHPTHLQRASKQVNMLYNFCLIVCRVFHLRLINNGFYCLHVVSYSFIYTIRPTPQPLPSWVCRAQSHHCTVPCSGPLSQHTGCATPARDAGGAPICPSQCHTSHADAMGHSTPPPGGPLRRRMPPCLCRVRSG